MKVFKNTLSLLFLSFFIQFNIQAQDSEWDKQFSKDGKIEVLSKISKESDKDGNNIQIIEYKVTTEVDLELNKCVSAVSNIENHKDFYSDTQISKKIKDLSDNESLVYFFIDSQWPLPNSDCVSIMSIAENKAAKYAEITLIAVPEKYEMKDVKRMSLSETTFSFNEREDGLVVFQIKSKFSPVINAPSWLIKSWFPDGPIEMTENIIEIIKSQ